MRLFSRIIDSRWQERCCILFSKLSILDDQGLCSTFQYNSILPLILWMMVCVCVNRDHLPSSLYFSLELSDLMIYGWPKYEFHRIKNFAFKAEGSLLFVLRFLSTSGPDGHIWLSVLWNNVFKSLSLFFRWVPWKKRSNSEEL